MLTLQYNEPVFILILRGRVGCLRQPRWGEIFRTCPDWPWGPPSLLYNWYQVFPGGKVRLGHKADPSPPSSAEVKNRVELYLYSPYGPSWPTKGWNLRSMYLLSSKAISHHFLVIFIEKCDNTISMMFMNTKYNNFEISILNNLTLLYVTSSSNYWTPWLCTMYYVQCTNQNP